LEIEGSLVVEEVLSDDNSTATNETDSANSTSNATTTENSTDTSTTTSTTTSTFAGEAVTITDEETYDYDFNTGYNGKLRKFDKKKHVIPVVPKAPKQVLTKRPRLNFMGEAVLSFNGTISPDFPLQEWMEQPV